MKYKFTKEQFQEAVDKSISFAETFRALGMTPKGGRYAMLKNILKQYGISVKHFTNKPWTAHPEFSRPYVKQELSEILVENSTRVNVNALKKRMYKEGLKEKQCEICGITDWLNNPITLELDHINGINNDNRLENLRILCPNCHSQTHTFRGKNKESVTSKLREDNYNNKHLLKIEKIPKPKKERKVRILIPKNKCLVCDNLVKENRFKYCSYECSKAVMRQNVPTKEDIISAFKMYKNFLQVGNYFNVSDNAVRKWCMKYNILEEMKLLR